MKQKQSRTKSNTSTSYEHLRAALLRAALEQSTAAGPDSISFRELARRLGVTTAAPYYHFRDKGELLLLLAVEGFSLLLQRLQEASARALMPEEKTAAVIRAYIEFGRQERGYYGIMFHRDVIRPENIPLLEGPAAICFDLVRSVIAQANPALSISQTFERAIAAWTFLHGMLILSASGPLARRLPPELEEEFAIRTCNSILRN